MGLGRWVAGFEHVEHGWVARGQVGTEEVGVEFLNGSVTGWEDAADSRGVCGEEGVAGGDAREVLVVYDDEIGEGAVLEGCDVVVGE
jgi:hypothetical protein